MSKLLWKKSKIRMCLQIYGKINHNLSMESANKAIPQQKYKN